jgi:serine/threonine protein kinase
MRAPDNAANVLFKLIPLYVNMADLKQIMDEVGEWKEVSNHPNIVEFYGCEWDAADHRLVLVCEFMDRYSLRDLLQPPERERTKLTEDVAGAVMAQVSVSLYVFLSVCLSMSLSVS